MDCISQMNIPDNQNYWKSGEKSNWYKGCTDFCESTLEADPPCTRTQCMNYCAPYQGLTESVSEPSQPVEKHNLKRKDVLIISVLILLAYLLTTSVYTYKLTGMILPTVENGVPTLVGYSLHTLLFFVLVFVILHFYKVKN